MKDERGNRNWWSLLIVPGNRPDLHAKIPKIRPDAVILDLEDGVPEEAKVEARQKVRAAAVELRDHPEIAVSIRVNGVGTRWFDEDVATSITDNVSAIVVPKCESVDDVQTAQAAVRTHRGVGEVVLISGIETARGVANVEAITGAGVDVYFGAEDFVADMGGIRTANGNEVLYARSRVALAARVSSVSAYDQVVVDIRDDVLFRNDAALGLALGYCGKICLHPRQVELSHEVFRPSDEELAVARLIVDEYEGAQRDNRGVIVVDGRMADEPVVAQARMMLQRAES